MRLCPISKGAFVLELAAHKMQKGYSCSRHRGTRQDIGSVLVGNEGPIVIFASGEALHHARFWGVLGATLNEIIMGRAVG